MTNIPYTVMLLFSILSSLLCLLLPALVSSRVATPEDPVNLAAHHIKRLSSPLKNLLHRRDTILFAGAPDPSTGLALNSTNGAVVETIPFEQEIDIPTQGHVVYFCVCYLSKHLKAAHGVVLMRWYRSRAKSTKITRSGSNSGSTTVSTGE